MSCDHLMRCSKPFQFM